VLLCALCGKKLKSPQRTRRDTERNRQVLIEIIKKTLCYSVPSVVKKFISPQRTQRDTEGQGDGNQRVERGKNKNF